ncbi:MAG: HAD family hydrolase [Lachnospiraceae bacterium]|nr:HAD family hydrolase [Lachnospiraceae bacterium]
MIKAVFFDIDNTLYSYDQAHAAAMEKLVKFGEVEFSLAPKRLRRLLDETQQKIIDRLGTNCAAIHNRLIRFQCFLEALQYPDLTKAAQMDQIYETAFLDAMVMEPDLPVLLSELRKSQVRIGIGTDQNAHAQYRKLERLGILTYFSRIVTSEEAGAEKPDEKFFRLCVEKAGCRPEECVFIGDNIKKDVEGARWNGLRGIWYHPGEKEEEQREYPVIHSYAEGLRKILSL